MAITPNIGTDYVELVKLAVGPGQEPDFDAVLVLAKKSGKTTYDAAVLFCLARICQDMEARNA